MKRSGQNRERGELAHVRVGAAIRISLDDLAAYAKRQRNGLR